MKTRRRGRLVVFIYLYSLLSFLLSAAVLVLLGLWLFPPFEPHHKGPHGPPPVGAAPGPHRGERGPRDHGHGGFHPSMAIYSPDGTLISASDEAPPPPLTAAELAQLVESKFVSPRPGLIAHALYKDDKLESYSLVYPGTRSVPIGEIAILVGSVLLLLGLVSVAFARRLARPLQRLEVAANAFGAGDHAARAALDRHDEIGAAGRAFDDMADRVTLLLKSQKELMANISHELRTPLARMRVALDLASEGDADLAREVLGEIDTDLGELERLVEDVLTALRMDMTATLRLERVDAGELLALSASRFSSLYPSHRFLVERADRLAAVQADPALLRRAIDNLVDNARKYSDPGTIVTLAARADGDRVVLEVIDHGIGIDEADLGRLFTPFFRADRSRHRATGGVGLGLSLAKKIVEAHGGTLTVTSALGEGTTVRVVLGAAEGAA